MTQMYKVILVTIVLALHLDIANATGVCDKCNVPISSGGCKCDNYCNCITGNVCTKCNLAVSAGGCKCDNNCACLQSPPPPAGVSPSASPPLPAVSNTCSLSAMQKAAAFALTSLWENSVQEEQYAYCEALGDGRGYTAGIIGFCTSLTECGDAVLVVSRYSSTCGSAAKSSALAGFLPALSNNGGIGDNQVHTYKTFCAAWAAAVASSSGTCFKAVQDYYQDVTYYQPSQAFADARHLQYALSRAVLYDSIVQQGDGTGSSSLGGMLASADAAWRKANGGGSGALPARHTNAQEISWLSTFLSVRLKVLNSDPVTWGQSVSRIYAYQNLIAKSEFSLSGAVTFKAAPDWPDLTTVNAGGTLSSAAANCGPLAG